MRRVTLLLVLAGCATSHARPRDPYARAFEACFDRVRAHSCAASTPADQDACMQRFGLRYDGAGSRGARRALLVEGGCPSEVVAPELGR